MMTAQENLGAEFSLEEIYVPFPDDWIALFVTDDRGDGRSLRGRLMAHGCDRGRMYAAELDFARSHPGAHTAVFFACPVTDTVIVF
jgi:hypothetical protein